MNFEPLLDYKKKIMEELTLTTPALLFSAVSLILLAYTNRFLSYAQLVRQLRDRYMENPSDITEAQIENLRKRLNQMCIRDRRKHFRVIYRKGLPRRNFL